MVPQYFVTDCLNFEKHKCRSLQYETLPEFNSGIIVIALLCSIRQQEIFKYIHTLLVCDFLLDLL